MAVPGKLAVDEFESDQDGFKQVASSPFNRFVYDVIRHFLYDTHFADKTHREVMRNCATLIDWSDDLAD